MNLTAQQNLEQIRQKRLKWVEANHENGFQQGIERLLSDLYPDQAHFVYELLQNAEDAQATEIHFQLRAKNLSVIHNGVRLFGESDVASITSIGNSTKRDNINQIGKFGVGFKAVFAYTKTPQVFSGDYAFRIHDLVIPEWIHDQAPSTSKTRFDFSFNNRKSPSQCFTEIADWLNNMPDTVLLFLRSISKISWEIEGQGSGQIYRENLKGTQVVEISRQATGDDTEYASPWLRFEKPVPDKPSLFVSIAYQLEQLGDIYKQYEEQPIAAQFKIRSADSDGMLFIFFPADKEKTKLKFHIHAPFAATVARDSIPYTAENKDLFGQIVNLTVHSLEEIKKLGLLGESLLSVLPLNEDGLSDFYQPISKQIRAAMQCQSLAPVLGGGHALASDLFFGRQEIYRVIDNEFLTFFTENPASRWAIICDLKSRAGRFLREIGING